MPASSAKADGAPPLLRSRRGLAPFLIVGLVCVIGGGLLSAVTAPVPSEDASWAAAYLVLVGGVAQAGLGLGQAMFTVGATPRMVAVQVGGWNLGNAAVLAGTVLEINALVDVGGALLVVTLALLARGLGGRGVAPGPRRYWLHAYRLLVLVLLVSIPVGLVLARTRG